MTTRLTGSASVSMRQQVARVTQEV
ncbi:hypothetical protein E2C01_092442 [Portunus trituberculatus]|uniref:Uncharacterized protein n=1 Tax=Portunus trituberculatus TaxID=210409 RepID=A0A5B7JVT8_PORTR|nr:hypothetical protein [Portunus trituberculatus]